MSLRDAVSVIAEAMDQEAVRYGDGSNSFAPLLRAYATQLKIALHASREEEKERITAKDVGLMPDLFGDVKRQAREEAAIARKEAAGDTPIAPFTTAEIAEAAPGSEDVVGDMIQVTGMPVRAYLPVGGAMYQLREDGRLYYSEQKTQEWRESRTRPCG